MIQALVSCHLDYYNSLLYGVSDSLIHKLQSVQNTAAHLITRVRWWCNHITPVLHQLHWHPVQQQGEFKFQSCMPDAPTDGIRRVDNSINSQRPIGYTLFNAHATDSFSNSSLSVTGPCVCNSVPSYARQDINYKTKNSSSHWKHFCLGFSWWRHIVNTYLHLRNILTYLLTYLYTDRAEWYSVDTFITGVLRNIPSIHLVQIESTEIFLCKTNYTNINTRSHNGMFSCPYRRPVNSKRDEKPLKGFQTWGKIELRSEWQRQ